MNLEKSDGSHQQKRFATLTKDDCREILTTIDPRNTQRATESSSNTFRDYLKEKYATDPQWLGLELGGSAEAAVLFEKFDNGTLDRALEKFYAEARTKAGDPYKMTSLNTQRYGLNRHMTHYCTVNELAAVDINSRSQFPKSNRMFRAVAKEKLRTTEERTSRPPIKDDHLWKISEYFQENVRDNPTVLQQKVFFDLLLYFGVRGRESLRLLKKSDFAVAVADGEMYVYSVRDDPKDKQVDGTRRMWEVRESSICPVQNFLTYLKQLNPGCMWLFQRPKKVFRNEGPWYENMTLGQNTLGGMMAKISEQAGLPRSYTNDSLRATCVPGADAMDARDVSLTNSPGLVVVSPSSSNFESLDPSGDNHGKTKRSLMLQTVTMCVGLGLQVVEGGFWYQSAVCADLSVGLVEGVSNFATSTMSILIHKFGIHKELSLSNLL